MGQYHYTVNLDKEEFIHPHRLGDGLKLAEQCGWSPGGTNDALHLLLAVSSGRGGGDFQSPTVHEGGQWVGRWGGDRIAVVGDYAEDSDLPANFEASRIYGECQEEGRFNDITDDLIPTLEAEYELVYFGDGWRERRSLMDVIKDWQYSHLAPEGRVGCIGGQNYLLADLIPALKAKLAAQGRGGEFKPITVKQLGVSPLGAPGNILRQPH